MRCIKLVSDGIADAKHFVLSFFPLRSEVIYKLSGPAGRTWGRRVNVVFVPYSG